MKKTREHEWKTRDGQRIKVKDMKDGRMSRCKACDGEYQKVRSLPVEWPAGYEALFVRDVIAPIGAALGVK